MAAGCGIDNYGTVLGNAYEECEHSSGYFATYASCSSGLEEYTIIDDQGKRTHCYNAPLPEIRSLVTSG